jgi:8-oxo-dGTP diphosphatase
MTSAKQIITDPNAIQSGRNLPRLAKTRREAMNNDERSRTYPTRPYLAVSAAIFRDGHVLIVRRARAPANGLYTLPGGGVELGETLEEAVVREVMEETSLVVEPVGLAGYRQAIARDAQGGVERHFVILPFAARWISGEVSLNEELGEAHWLEPSAIADLKTTEGLALIVGAAQERLAAAP